MRILRGPCLIFALCFTPLELVAGPAQSGTPVPITSLDTNHPLQASGTLYLPAKAVGPAPAIVLVHGTMGIDARGAFYREAILDEGIAILEVDFKTGIYHSPQDRPAIDSYLPLAFAALKDLRKRAGIDPSRIGIMGFSMGGGITVRAALENHRKAWMRDEKGFAAHAAFYPVCRYINPKVEQSGGLSGAPMIIFYGTEDSYGEGNYVPEFKKLLLKKFSFDVTTVEYPGAAHGFNRDAAPLSYSDPAAMGGKGFMAWNPEAASDSRTRVVAFLREKLAGK